MIVSCAASFKFYGTRPGQCAEQFQELKIYISPQFRAIDPPNRTGGFIQQNQNVRLATTACHPKFENARFATATCAKLYDSSARRPRQPAAYTNHHFTTVSDVRLARTSDERVAPSTEKLAFHHSFGRPISTKRRKSCARTQRICISPQFWASDEHEVTRGLSPAAVHKTYPAEKRRKKFSKKSSSFSKHSLYPQPFSAAILSSPPLQPFPAALPSSHSQQPLSAALLSSHSQLSSCCGQGLVVSYCHQLLSSCCCGQGLLVSYYLIMLAAILIYLAVVRGWWSALIMLLWSGVGGQLFDHHFTVVRSWWSTVHTFFRRTLSKRFPENQTNNKKRKTKRHPQTPKTRNNPKNGKN